MTMTYRLRGIELDSGNEGDAGTSIPQTSSKVGVSTLRRMAPGTARDAGVAEIEAAGDEVVRVEFENGLVLWTRADDLVQERGRKTLSRDGAEVWEIDVRPRLREGQGNTRGWLGLGIKVLAFFGVDLKGKTARELGKALESKVLDGNKPGLYRCPLNTEFSLTLIPDTEVLADNGGPTLVFIHGTGSSCEGSFGKLWERVGAAQQAARARMYELYGDRVYAWEHRSLTESPIHNALELARRLPANSPVHLVSHSRGGLVGELLCLGQRDRDIDPLQAKTLEELFAADRTMAEQLGLGALDSKAKAERDKAYAEDRGRLAELCELLTQKNFSVDRFVRVACPARGTTLASGRLDRWLSVLDLVSGNGLFGDVADFLLAVVKERTDPRTLPGLEAMMPGSALTHLLHLSDLQTTSDLTVIAGDTEGDSLWGQLKLLAADWFYGADHDLVVNTGSMYGGIRRSAKAARFLRDKGSAVNHFNYFQNSRSVGWLVDGLTRSEGSTGGFQPIEEARHEAPKWREAVRRSRAALAPRPLAVVLPGTMGSALDVWGKEVWIDYWRLLRGGLKRIRIGADGVDATDLLDDFYGPLLEFLARSHRVEIFPYDWRLSVQDAATKLTHRLETLLPDAERSGQAVHLVAHSMGGLVVRAMLADEGAGAAVWRRISALPNSRFMMLGTPNHGSFEAMRWLTGHNPTELKLSLLDFTQDTNQVIDIVRRYPGLLELLPFGEGDPDFTRKDLWVQLKEETGAGWEPADAAMLRNAGKTWTLLKTAVPDPTRMIYIAGCQPATVTDYELVDSRSDSRARGGKRLDYIATRQGDGTVTWQSGLLPGVRTWYVDDTAHDELCAQQQAFPGYLDLLMSGNTNRLTEAFHAAPRGAAEADRFVMPQQLFTDDLPDELSVRRLGFGPSRPPGELEERPVLPRIRVGITHGNLMYARHHVLVGHYLGDTIVSAESALDQRLDHAMSDRMQLGIYPGAPKTHALFWNQKYGARPSGALVVGLGQVGDLSSGTLEVCLRKAMLDFALQMAQRENSGPDNPQGVCAAALSCLLVGSGAGGITVRDSIEATLRSAVAANDKLVEAGLDGKVLIDEIEFLELFEDVAITAAEALEQVLTDGQVARSVEWPARVVEAGEGGYRRVRFDDAPDWWERLEIIERPERDGLRFIATTDRARAEETQSGGQLLLADAFIRQATRSPRANLDVSKTLFEMLLPNRMKEWAPKQQDLVLLLDEVSARYPWELLEDRWSQSGRPVAVAGGLVRQLKTSVYRAVPVHAADAKAYVVGNPDLEQWRTFPDLPGARKEAQRVAGVLSQRGFLVEQSIDERADRVVEGLHRDSWRILHLAGHGEHEFELNGGLEQGGRRVSGMVIGKDTFLTPGDVSQMRWVPELVFVNCCHLGKTQVAADAGRPGDYNLLAANLAVEFVRMGVKAVVAAGWAVDDRAALAFAESFYTHLLDGECFGDAVRAAREEVWVQFPDVNTWGAYQCYGDPSYRLRSNPKRTAPATPRPFHTSAELVVELHNLTESIRMESREAGDGDETLEMMRGRIAALIERIPERQREPWLARADVAMALGFAWGELGDYAEGVHWLERSMGADRGEVSVRAVEQHANFKVRHVGEQWRQLQTRAGSADSKEVHDAIAAQRQVLVDGIDQASAALDYLCQRAPTVERLNLLGSACKRLAMVHSDQADRAKALANMARHYRRAFELRQRPDPYAFNNWALARAINSPGKKPLTAAERKALREECERMMELLRELDLQQPNFWTSAGRSDLELVLLLADSKLSGKQAEGATGRIISGYREAFKRGASVREVASVREHLEFIIELNASRSTLLKVALAEIRKAL
jgi:pimeloyl-ACP methyl ester carboxylesterase